MAGATKTNYRCSKCGCYENVRGKCSLCQSGDLIPLVRITFEELEKIVNEAFPREFPHLVGMNGDEILEWWNQGAKSAWMAAASSQK